MTGQGCFVFYCLTLAAHFHTCSLYLHLSALNLYRLTSTLPLPYFALLSISYFFSKYPLLTCTGCNIYLLINQSIYSPFPVLTCQSLHKTAEGVLWRYISNRSFKLTWAPCHLFTSYPSFDYFCKDFVESLTQSSKITIWRCFQHINFKN